MFRFKNIWLFLFRCDRRFWIVWFWKFQSNFKCSHRAQFRHTDHDYGEILFIRCWKMQWSKTISSATMYGKSHSSVHCIIFDLIVKQCDFSHIYLNFRRSCYCCWCFSFVAFIVLFYLNCINQSKNVSHVFTMHRFHCYCDSNWIFFFALNMHTKISAHSFPCIRAIFVVRSRSSLVEHIHA